MLTPFDDYPLHQTSAPLAIPATGDPNYYDRYFFNGYSPDASVYFGVALGLYPNREVIDGAFSAIIDGEQTSLHVSGRCPLDRTNTTVGPLRVEIIEPMRVLRVLVEAPDHGISADLVFRARTAPVQEPPFLIRENTRTTFDITRLTQFGTWEGHVEVAAKRIEVRGFLGSRDRSWGVRPVGERLAGAPRSPGQFYWLWAPVNFADVCTHFDVNEYADGERWHEAGFVVPVGDDPARAARAVDYRIAWRPGTRRARSFELDLAMAGGEKLTLSLEPLLDFQMLGLGYLHPEWGHGLWKGESADALEHWAVPVSEPLSPHYLHIQSLCRAELGDRVGMGVLEQLVIGPHAPSGFKAMLDGAP